MKTIAIIGGGPAGLTVAEKLSGFTNLQIHLFDAKPSVGRKFLIAGRGGLNLTHSEPLEQFATRYTGPALLWKSLLDDFDPGKLREWSASLGFETYKGSSGRIFPKGDHAAGLLRAWVKRLHEKNVCFHMRHHLTGLRQEGKQWSMTMNTPEGSKQFAADAVCLAMGGASWPQTGSDGLWSKWLGEVGITISSFSPANCGWNVDWPVQLLPHIEGQPLKNIRVSAGKHFVSGELVVTSYGLEGGPIYALGRHLRVMKQPALIIDWKPQIKEEALRNKLGSVANKDELFDRAVTAWNLSNPCRHLLERAGARKLTVHQLVNLLKNYRLLLKAPRPIDEGISSAGGIRWEELSPDLMLCKLPGIFVAGEMIDWEAPTGGYLLQGCFATGTRAAQGIDKYLTRSAQ